MGGRRGVPSNSCLLFGRHTRGPLRRHTCLGTQQADSLRRWGDSLHGAIPGCGDLKVAGTT